MSAREVYDPDRTMSYSYRGRVVTITRRRSTKYRGVIDKHFMGWKEHDRSGKFKSWKEAEGWCTAWLDRIESKFDGDLVGDESAAGSSQEADQ